MHHLLLDFLETCTVSDRTELAQQLKEQIVPLLHTREGVKVAMACLWNSNNKACDSGWFPWLSLFH